MFNPQRIALSALLLSVFFVGGCGDEPADAPPAVGPAVGPAAGIPADVHVGADGKVALRWERTPEAEFSFSGPDPMQRDKAVTAFKSELRSAADKGPRNEDKSSKITLRIEAAPDAKWLHVQWAMQAASDPDVRIWRLCLRTEGVSDWTPLVLPRDSGKTDAGPLIGEVALGAEYSTVKVALNRVKKNAGAQTKMIIDGETTFLFPMGKGAGDENFEVVMVAAERVAKMALETKKPEVVDIAAGGSVPFADVLRMYHMALALGHDVVTFQGAPSPRSGG